MTRILILYGTTNGHTAKIAGALSALLRAAGASVDVFDSRHAQPDPDDYEGVIVAASVHAGGYQKAVLRWVRSHGTTLNAKPTAFISVCLGVSQRQPEVDRELQAIVDRFMAATGWHPTVTKTVAGALLYTQYNWFIRFAMKRIVTKAGGDTDTTRDYEYTDWKDLEVFATAFLRMVEARDVAIPPAVVTV